MGDIRRGIGNFELIWATPKKSKRSSRETTDQIGLDRKGVVLSLVGKSTKKKKKKKKKKKNTVHGTRRQRGEKRSGRLPRKTSKGRGRLM